MNIGRRGGRGGFRVGPGAPVLFIVTVLAGALLLAETLAEAQTLDPGWSTGIMPENGLLPFGAGESLEFRVTSSRFGEVGTGRMSVEPAAQVRGRDVLLLSMHISGRIALFRFEDHARSWIDPSVVASLRFEKQERHPLARRNEAVEMLLEEGRWEDAEGGGGPLGAGAPLDELSFIYFLRTLDLEEGEVRALNRHFDLARNPVQVSGSGRETISVPAGQFNARVVEMVVQDPHRFGRDGTRIRIHFSDDARRLPLRIESSMPMVGSVVLTLESYREGE